MVPHPGGPVYFEQRSRSGHCPLENLAFFGSGQSFQGFSEASSSKCCTLRVGHHGTQTVGHLVKLMGMNGRLLGIVGVENKVWSGEQHNQLSDYQAALCEQFPSVPKILLFLTPDEREPLTRVDSGSCLCRPCSYMTLVTLCKE